ncbi:MAG: PilZ domain, partial [Myxococcaceae bacterium]|nr:PilZ domain [Myxococcaceae bacterium]
MSAATNRRRFPRVKPKQLATRVRSGDDLHIGLGIENISMGGAFVRCNSPMKVGRAVVLEVMRAGASQPLEIEGKVTSSVSLAVAAATQRTAGMGITFDPLPPHVEQRLEGLI